MTEEKKPEMKSQEHIAKEDTVVHMTTPGWQPPTENVPVVKSKKQEE